MKNEGGRKAGSVRRWCRTVAIDVCLLVNAVVRRLFFNLFAFPVCKAQLIGDWHGNRRGVPNTILLLIIRQ
jgi:hypothetical protein